MLLEHNKSVYSNLENTISHNNKAIIISATGTGKSYLILEYAESHNLNTLVVVPKRSIGYEWENLSKLFKSITYHSFVKKIDFSDYDLVVFDEVHHAGATTWQGPVSNFVTKAKIPVIGLTADPKRYSDGARDMAAELFKDCIVEGYNLADAITDNILPKITYVSAMWSVDSIKNKYKDKEIPAPLLGKFNYSIENRKPVEEIIKDHMPVSTRKGIIFVDTISAAKDAEAWFSKLYPEMPLWCIHARQSQNLNIEYHEEFKNAKTGYMISIDMYNEGLHAPGVNTIIMLRRTKSPSVFYQQIGRALQVGNADDPIVFDCVCNSKMLTITTVDRGARNQIGTVQSVFGKISEQVVLYDYTKDIFDLIEQIDNQLDTMWSENEINILKEYYPTEGIEVAKRLPDRKVSAIIAKASKLGILSETQKWTNEEEKILKKYYELEGGAVSERLPGRSFAACKAKAEKMGMYYNPNKWTDEDLEILKKYYPIEGIEVLKRLPGRTKTSVMVKANLLKLRKKSSDWTKEEDDIIKKYYPDEGIEVLKRLPGRTRSAVKNRAVTLKVKKRSSSVWTDKEIEILKKYYPDEGLNVAKRLPGRTAKAIGRQVHIHQIKRNWENK